MNETNFSPRQKFILNLISSSNGLTREEIQEEVKKSYKISKPTLIRDLNFLIGKNFIRVVGKGKKTRYYPYTRNPLLKSFDINLYFLEDPDKRINVKKKFDFAVFEHLSNLFSSFELGNIDKVKKSFREQVKKLNTDILKKELERFVIELSWKSSKIEGNTYTLLETEELIKKNRRAEGKSREEAVMILNHKDAFEKILKDKNKFKKITLSEINQLHNVLIKGLNVNTGIRKHAVGITGTAYMPLDNEFQVREAMEKLIKAINNNENPLEKALIANSIVSYIQPYSDGNKRTGRMLTNGILLAYDYYPLSYRNIDEGEFKKALILFYEQGSIYHLKRLFIEQLIFAYNTYFK